MKKIRKLVEMGDTIINDIEKPQIIILLYVYVNTNNLSEAEEISLGCPSCIFSPRHEICPFLPFFADIRGW